MRLTNQVRSFLIEQDYYIDIYEGNIHVFQYIDINKLLDDEIVLQMNGFQLVIKGEGFRVKRLEKKEILISGTLKSLSLEV